MTREDYTEIKTQADLERLMDLYGGFHDSVITEVRYKTGGYVDETLSMGCGKEQDYELVLCLSRQWRPTEIELRFTGVRQAHLAGFEPDCVPFIYSGYAAFHDDLIAGQEKPLILWRDAAGVINAGEEHKNLLSDPSLPYVIASGLTYRIYDQNGAGAS